jgi:trehalose-6-phosphate synthase
MLQSLKDILKLVDEIHDEFGHGCLIFKQEHINMEERCALWNMSNIMLNTCLRDGLTLQPLEFVSVKK